MIELLPVISIVAVSIWLSIKAFDSLVEAVVFIHDMHEFQLIFDDYEAELLREDINKDTAVELRSHLAKDLSGVLPADYRPSVEIPLLETRRVRKQAFGESIVFKIIREK